MYAHYITFCLFMNSLLFLKVVPIWGSFDSRIFVVSVGFLLEFLSCSFLQQVSGKGVLAEGPDYPIEARQTLVGWHD